MSKIDYQALREIAKHHRLTEESASYAMTNASHSMRPVHFSRYPDLPSPHQCGFLLPDLQVRFPIRR